MDNLASLIAFLPPEVTGRDVYAFLSLFDLVRLDSAVMNRKIRSTVVHSALAITSVQIKPLSPPNWLEEAWSWCLKRGVQLDDMDIWEVNVTTVGLLSEVLSRLSRDGNVRWNCDVSNGTSLSESYSTMDSCEIIGRLTHLRLSGQPHDDSIPDLCHKMTRLRSLCLTYRNDAEQMICSILEVVPPLAELWLPQALLRERSLSAFCRHATTLKTLHLTYHGQLGAMLLIIGQWCVHLEEFYLFYYKLFGVTPDREREIVEGLVAVAKGCRRLRCLSLSCPHLTEPVLKAIAQHCTDLRTLDVGFYGAELTNAVLVAMATNCPHLCKLSSFKWRVTSMDAVEAAGPLFQRLTSFSMTCALASASTAPALANALSCSRARSVQLSAITKAFAGGLAQCSVSLPCCNTLSLYCDFVDAQAADLLLLSMAVTSGVRLRELSLYGATASDAALLTLAEQCPNLDKIIVAKSAITEATLVAAVQRWPLLTFLLIAGNASITAAVLDALATYCPMLKTLRLDLNRLVTVSEVMEFVTRMPTVMVSPPRRFTAEQRAMVHAAKSAAMAQLAVLT